MRQGGGQAQWVRANAGATWGSEQMPSLADARESLLPLALPLLLSALLPQTRLKLATLSMTVPGLLPTLCPSYRLIKRPWSSYPFITDVWACLLGAEHTVSL